MNARRLSAGVVVVRADAGRWRYLLLRAYHYWDFPKGLVEPGETPLDGACREVEEETAIRDLAFRWGHDFYQTAPYGKGKIARYYLAQTGQEHIVLPVSAELGRPEHEEYRWLPYAEARALLTPRVQAVIDWAAGRLEDSQSPATSSSQPSSPAKR